MIDLNKRAGRFTSSEIFRLMKDGKETGSKGVDFYNYIEEVNLEREMGLPLEMEISSWETS